MKITILCLVLALVGCSAVVAALLAEIDNMTEETANCRRYFAESYKINLEQDSHMEECLRVLVKADNVVHDCETRLAVCQGR